MESEFLQLSGRHFFPQYLIDKVKTETELMYSTTERALVEDVWRGALKARVLPLELPVVTRLEVSPDAEDSLKRFPEKGVEIRVKMMGRRVDGAEAEAQG